MVASDFPHENNLESVKKDIGEFRSLEGVEEQTIAKMLSENAVNFYQAKA
jgi:hypothetical protein